MVMVYPPPYFESNEKSKGDLGYLFVWRGSAKQINFQNSVENKP